MPPNNDQTTPPARESGTAPDSAASATPPETQTATAHPPLPNPEPGTPPATGGDEPIADTDSPATVQKKRRRILKRIAGKLRRRGLQIPDLDITKPIRILIVTDAWAPQVNGVVRSLETLGRELTKMGHEVRVIEPGAFKTVPMPTYPEIRLALHPTPQIKEIIREFQPNAIHIATEGPLGWAARNLCVRRKLAFTTSFHTRFPEYVHARIHFPKSWSYSVLRRFHKPASTMMVATQSLLQEMTDRGFKRLQIWSRGVDLDLFYPRDKSWLDLPRPVWLYVGRAAVEKNIEAFLKMDVPGTKLVVGDGPQMNELKSRYPEAVFAGAQFGEDLAKHYAASDIFVFPSKTDTFGLVLIEALASGIPVAAYPIQGPLDVIGDAEIGALDNDLTKAALTILERNVSPEDCRAYAMNFSWEACAGQFLSNLAVDEEPPLEEEDIFGKSTIAAE